MKKILSLFLMTIMLLSEAAAPVYAVQHSDISSPLIPIPQAPVRPLQKAVEKLSVKTDLKPEVLGLLDNSAAQKSAHKRLPLKIERLKKEDFKAAEEVSILVNNPDKSTFATKVLDAEGKEKPVEVHTVTNGVTTEFLIDGSNQFTPGKYTIEITDQTGQTVKQDFTWGVLAINPDKTIYMPNEKAFISLGVLDEKGEMVCDASVSLQITKPDGTVDALSTDEQQIIVNPDCHSKTFTLKPDYETTYTMGGVGEYKVVLTANTQNGSYTITDSFHVQESVAFDVKRTSATRIYPPLVYPVNLEITANQDFEGTVTETVPESFTITPSTEANSYDKMNTLYLNSQKDPAKKLKHDVLGSSTGLVMPFDGTYQISQGFGTEMTDVSLKNFYSHYGLGGHDGIDFALPMGTPLYAADEGNILVAGYGDYGITVVIQHTWGRSYYGHLSKVTVEANTSVTKGSLIGYSGNTGESTGPHLHFGMKPNNPDTNNGYAGKVDPLQFLPAQGTNVARSLNLPNLQSVLSASDSAESPENTPETSLTEPAVAPKNEPISAEITSQPVVVASTAATLPPTKDYTVQDDQIRKDISYSTSPKIEKVKVIKWQVSLKKGEKTTLSYAYKAPQVSPQFYTVGPLKFFAKSNNTIVFEEKRAWQIAADAIGVDWYNKSWQYRKSVTIDKDKIGVIQDPWCNIATGATCTTSWSARRKVTINNTASGTNLSNFPILVVLNSGRIDYAKTQSAGQDLRFVDANGTTLLSYEIEEFNETGNDYVWVKVPQIDANSGADFIWMYYGNAGASAGASATGVWDSNFQAVWHLNQNGDNVGADYLDSTSNAKHGTGGGGTAGKQPALLAAGKVSGAQTFTPETDWIDIASTISYTNDISIGVWFIGGSQTAGAWNYFIDNDAQSIEFGTFGNSLNVKDNNFNATAATGSFNDSTWHYAVGVISGTSILLYVDGQLEASGAYPGGQNYGAVGWGIGGTSVDKAWGGSLDEMRLSNSARSADWVEAEYLTMQDSMNSFGSEETQSAGNVTLSNFPVLINLTTDTQLAGKAQTDADDILFTDNTGRTKIPHEIESYNSGTGALVAWVKPSSVNNQTDTDIYLYYGNPAATNQEDATNVWDSNFRANWHLGEGSGTTAADSTSFAKTLTLSTSSWAAGQIGTAWNGIGSGWLSRADDADFDFAAAGTPTINLWFKSDSATNPSATQYILNKSLSGGTQESGYAVYANTNGTICFGIDDDTTWNPDDSACSSTDFYDNTWHYLSALKNGTSGITLYIDGQAVGADSTIAAAGTLANARILYLGDRQGADGTDEFVGDIDQASIALTNRSADWIGTEYSNQSSPSTFYSLGSEETYIYAPTNNELMRHGNFFDSSGSEQPFAY